MIEPYQCRESIKIAILNNVHSYADCIHLSCGHYNNNNNNIVIVLLTISNKSQEFIQWNNTNVIT